MSYHRQIISAKRTRAVESFDAHHLPTHNVMHRRASPGYLRVNGACSALLGCEIRPDGILVLKGLGTCVESF